MAQLIAGRRRRGVQADRSVDDELLAIAALIVADAVMGEDPQATHGYAVQADRDLLLARPGFGRVHRVVLGVPIAELGTGASRCPPGDAARRHASATRTASALAGTWCTRAHQAPPAAASAVTATVASSEPENGRTVPSGAASSRPRKRFRDAPTSTGNAGPGTYNRETRSKAVSSDQLCSGSLAKPSPGSSTMSAGSTPSAMTASTRCRNSRHTSVTTSA